MILLAHYIIQEGARYYPKRVITYYFSPLCESCYEYKDAQDWDKDTAVIFQPVIMDDHDVTVQVFILSLIKKFRMTAAVARLPDAKRSEGEGSRESNTGVAGYPLGPSIPLCSTQDDFWSLAKQFKTLEPQHMTKEEIATQMGFTQEEITWMAQNPDYQSEVRKELRNPVKAYLDKRHKHIIKYKTILDSEISHVPMKSE